MIDPSLFTLPYDNALAMGLIALGHNVKLYGRKIGPDDNDLESTELVPIFYNTTNKLSKFHLSKSLRLASKGIDHVWSMVRLLRSLRRERPDVIHFQWLPLPLVDQRLLSEFSKVAPLILTVHDTNPFNGDPSASIQSRGVSACFNKVGRLVVHTRQGVNRLIASGVSADKIMLLPHGRSFDSLVKSAPDPMDSMLTFLLFGKIKPYKGVDVLINAFSRMPDNLQQQARVRIVGKPYMDMSSLYRAIQENSMQDRISIEPGFIPDSEIPGLFGPGVVCVFPYRELETSGVLSQALAFGRPIIASKLGVFAETLQDGLHGYLVPPNNIDELTNAMSQMVENRSFASACSSAIFALNSNLDDWITVAKRTAEVYNDCRLTWQVSA